MFAQIGEVVSTIPSMHTSLVLPSANVRLFPAIGFNVETVQVCEILLLTVLISLTHLRLQYKNIKFQVWDLGGQSSIRYFFSLSLSICSLMQR